MSDQIIAKLDGIAEGINTKADKTELETAKAEVAALVEKVKGMEVAIAKGAPAASGIEVIGSYKDAFHNYLTKANPMQVGAEDNLLNAKAWVNAQMKLASATAKELMIKKLSEESNGAGGYLVPADRIAGVIKQQELWMNPIRKYAGKRTTSSNIVEINNYAHMSNVQWGSAPTASTGTPVGQIQIPVHNVYAKYDATSNLVEDAGADVETIVLTSAMETIEQSEGQKFLAGTGSNEPMGILNYTLGTTEAYGTIQKVTTAGSGVIAAADLVGLRNKMHTMNRAGAAWLMNSNTLTLLETLEDSAGQFILKQEFLNSDSMGRMLGFPIIICDDMPDVSAGETAVMFANLGKGYLICDRLGLTMQRDVQTSWPDVLYKVRKRVGGGIVRFDCFKALVIKA